MGPAVQSKRTVKPAQPSGMTQQGATLQNYNNELVKCIEDLREKREEVNRSIAKDEEEKAKIQNDLRILTERLARINDNLARKITSRNEYDKTIQETEAAYSKVCQKSSVRYAGGPRRVWYPFRTSDHGEFPNPAPRAQARERQSHEEKAGLFVSPCKCLGAGRCPSAGGSNAPAVANANSCGVPSSKLSAIKRVACPL